jgi:hypothetical protein
MSSHLNVDLHIHSPHTRGAGSLRVASSNPWHVQLPLTLAEEEVEGAITLGQWLTRVTPTKLASSMSRAQTGSCLDNYQTAEIRGPRTLNTLNMSTLRVVTLFEGCRLLGCDAVWVLLEPTFRGHVSPLSSVASSC